MKEESEKVGLKLNIQKTQIMVLPWDAILSIQSPKTSGYFEQGSW